MMVVTGRNPGRIMLHASTLAYGVAVQDSLAFVIGWPTTYLYAIYTKYKTGTRTPVKYFAGDTITIGVGGNVLWINTSDTIKVDITFDDPAAASPPTGSFALFAGSDSGNIPPFAQNDQFGLYPGYAARSFARPGKYPFHSTLFGTGGVIVVCASSDSTCFSY
jgi:hypothetical protein